VLADLAQELEMRNWRRPLRVVDEPGGILCHFEIEEAGKLHLDGSDAVRKLVAGQERALVGAARRIADEPRCAAGERDGVMAGQLKTAEQEKGDETADV
jgi:hypothetical protein